MMQVLPYPDSAFRPGTYLTEGDIAFLEGGLWRPVGWCPRPAVSETKTPDRLPLAAETNIPAETKTSPETETDLDPAFADDPAPETKTPETFPDETKTPAAEICETKTLSETKTRNKGGRPRRTTDPPWIAAGMTRATWYRKKGKRA